MAAPAASLSAPEGLYRARPMTGPSRSASKESAAVPVTIGLGSVSVTESWIVPPGGALASRILMDTPLKSSGPLPAVSRRPAAEQRASTRKNSGVSNFRR